MKNYDIVHAIYDYNDGPCSGVADFEGWPHAFECIFDESRDTWSENFLLRPIEKTTLEIVLEDWKIWLRWYTAFQEGRVQLDSHGALPDDRQRHEELQVILKEQLRIDPSVAVKAHGVFKRPDGLETGYTPTGQYLACWTRSE